MVPLDLSDVGFRKFVAKELNLSDSPRFSSCDLFRGTHFAKTCIGVVHDRDIVYVLLRGSFLISGDAIILNLDFPGAPDLTLARKELIGSGLAPKNTRLVSICVNSRAGMEGAEDEPEMQVVLVPY
jgi:hypothetical protein